MLLARDEFVFGRRLGGVGGDIDEDRTRTAAAGQGECLPHGVGDVGRVLDEERALGDRQRDTGDVDFLECIFAHHAACDIAGDKHDGRTVQHGGGHTGGEVGRAGAGCRQADAHLAGGTRITVSRMAGALFVRRADVADLAALVQFVIDVQDRAAGEPEHGVDFLLEQTLDKYFSSCQ